MSGSYPIIFSLGALAALLWLILAEPERPARQPIAHALRNLDIGICAIPAGLIGARAAYVAAYWTTFGDEPLSVFHFWDGGLYWGGGAIGALLMAGAIAKINHDSFWQIIDRLALPAIVLAFSSWFACLLDHCAYGSIADHGFLTPPAADVFGLQAPRWPVQSIGAIFSLLSLMLLNALRKRLPRDGSLGSTALVLISLGNLLLTFLRGDPVPVWGQLRMDGAGSAILLTLALAAFILRTPLAPKKRRP